MPLLTEKQREEFLSQDRARIYHLANGASEARATKLVTSMSRYQVRQHSAEYSEEQSSTEDGDGDDDDDDVKDDEEEGKSDLYESERDPVNLPQSTHTLFFTHPVCSAPFGFATAIVVISIGCLVLAFSDNFSSGSNPGNRFGIPANVDFQVRVAQYLAIVIALLMEEEIPTGAYLLRMIPSSAFQKKFPGRSYKRFVASALLRVVLGYIFLLNVLLILIKATGVLEIFYDVLALQFIAELDDMAFSLAKLDILGGVLRRATTARLFHSEFPRLRPSRSIKAVLYLKSVYFVNLMVFLAPMIIVSIRQQDGYYQCKMIKVDFGDVVWEDAFVRLPEGGYEKRTLAYSNFNGVYERIRTEAGRPVYQERRKFDRLEFDPWGKSPAEIKYSIELSAWIFTHPLLAKKKEGEYVPWLLRSPETDEYDVLNVEGDWDVWFGVIGATPLKYSCTECSTDTDCNFNGQCVNRECECNVEEETTFLGPHCEVKLKDKCATIFDGTMNLTWSIFRYSQVPGGPPGAIFEEYDRPVYFNIEGLDSREGDIHSLIYTGRRWKYIRFNYLDVNISFEEMLLFMHNYHGEY
mmetsp:Transcript_40394/g.87235  ORF Transcript_40394/g.87235 Transcript_40394/m.87235 type:complete len:579 (-) Transcript_40394:585-2321(-)